MRFEIPLAPSSPAAESPTMLPRWVKPIPPETARHAVFPARARRAGCRRRRGVLEAIGSRYVRTDDAYTAAEVAQVASETEGSVCR